MNHYYSKLRVVLCLVALGLLTVSGFWLFQQLNTNNQQNELALSLSKYQFDENTDPNLLKGKEKYAYYQYLYNKYNGYTKKQLKQIPKQDRPDLAFLQDFLRTADPNTGDIPIHGAILANQETDIRIASGGINQRAITGVQWTERGPNNVAGRTRALMYDPNDATKKKVWAAGVTGGLWVNNDITSVNSSWNLVNGFWENIGVTTIAYDPSNTQIMYVGTGEGFGEGVRGGGIWKTTNGGTTWTRLASTSPTVDANFIYMQKIVVTNNGTLLLACGSNFGGEGGIYRSTDGGASWTQTLNNAGRGVDLEIAADGSIYAGLNGDATITTGSIHKSTSASGGATWTNISPTTGVPTETRRIELASAPSNANIIYAVAQNNVTNNIAYFKKSVDGGTNWTDVTVPKILNQNCTVSAVDFTRGQAFYDLILVVNPTDPNHVLAGGIDIHRTTDGGTNWESISYWTGNCKSYVHADIHAFAYKPGSSTEMLAGTDGGVSYSTNLTATTPTFENRNKDYNVTQFYSVAMAPNANNDYLLGGTQDNGTQRANTAGVGNTVSVTGGDGGFAFIDQDNPCLQVTSYTNNQFYISNNSGVIFADLGAQDGNSGSFINPADYHDPLDLLYSANTTGNVARWTVPGGVRTDVAISNATGTITHVKASPYSPATTTTLYVGTSDGQVVRVPNAHSGTAATGTVISTGSMIGSVSCVNFGTSENEIIVTYSNYGVQSVWYSTDGGTSWTSKDTGHGLPDMPIRWALFNPNNTQEVLLATETGIWSTDNISADKQLIFGSLPMQVLPMYAVICFKFVLLIS